MFDISILPPESSQTEILKMQTKINHFSLSIVLLLFSTLATSSPQTNLLYTACAGGKAPDTPTFRDNLKNVFSDLLSQINGSTRFATAQRTSASPVYALFQCRDYLSLSDCLSCFTKARSDVTKCSEGISTGAKAMYDGCFLIYDTERFFERPIAAGIGTNFLGGNFQICGNKTASERNGSSSGKEQLLADLSIVTPKTKGYFAAARRGEGESMVYGVAQCVRTISDGGCKNCLQVAYEGLKDCLLYTEGRDVNVVCFLRFSDMPFCSDSFMINLRPSLKTGSSRTKNTIIWVVAGGLCVLLFLALLFFLFRQQSKKRKKRQEGDTFGITELRGPLNFRYNYLKSATGNFSKGYKLGEGGFGDVYKGVLRSGKIVAVKKLMISKSSSAEASFEAEVKLISNVHHRNLVRLLGCCRKGLELLLVYEYMENSSLDKFLFGARQGSLNWKQRFDIIVGTARGLAYLHEDFHVCIIHRDIKSSNILLDGDFQAKIADFGLARLLPGDQTHLSTKVAGTLGYTAPEYAILGQLSEKADTYSYGIVVLEIVSGRRCNDMREPITEYLLEWAWRLYESDTLMDLVDENLDEDDYEEEEVKRITEIALSCTQSAVSSRPTMSEVVVLLLGDARVTQRPSRPTFIDAPNRVYGGTSTSTGSSISNATLTISQMSGR